MELSQEKKEEVTDLLQSMIRSRSYSGEEQGVVSVLKEYMESRRFDDVHTDSYGNLIGIIHGRKQEKGPRVLFDGHMDTVPVPDPGEWTYPPFAAEIHDGRMYGRGTSDMKGALAAMTCAAASFAAQTGKQFSGDICVSGVVHEECFEGVAARSISAAVKPDIVVIGESSQLNLKIGQRGRAEIVLETFGKAAHSANPEKGINAVYKMASVISAIRSLTPPEHSVLGKGILELTDIKSSPYPGASVVPEYCRATYDRRLLVGETPESVMQPIQKLLDEMMEKDPELKVSAHYAVGHEKCWTGKEIEGERFFPGWLFDKNEDYIQAIDRELKAEGFEPKITQYNFCTNGSHYAGEAGIRTIGLGPSRENLAHTVDEYIEMDQLFKVVLCYEGVMRALNL